MDQNGDTALIIAIKEKKIDVIKGLLKQPDIKHSINQTDRNNCTPLCLAIQNKLSEIALILLNRVDIGPSINLCDINGLNPIQAAISVKSNIIKNLLERSDITERNKWIVMKHIDNSYHILLHFNNWIIVFGINICHSLYPLDE